MSRQKIEDGDTADEGSDIDEIALPSTYIVMQLDPDIPKTTLNWLIDKIRGRRRDGGGELILLRQPGSVEDVGIEAATLLLDL